MRPKTRSTGALALALAIGLASCAEAPSPSVAAPPQLVARAVEQPAPVATASSAEDPPANRDAEPAPASRGIRIDRETMKQYRVDSCYYGGLAFRQGRSDYLASLAGGSPRPGRVPTFAAIFMTATSTPIPVPFERIARSCAAAVALRDPDFGDVDTALAAWSPFALKLAKDLESARTYYERGDQVADGFARGNELHRALVAEFAQLDALLDRLGAAVNARRLRPAAPPTEDGDRLTRAAVDDAREVLLVAVAPKLDGAALDAARAKLQGSIASLEGWAASNPNDPWGKIMLIALDSFDETANATPRGVPRLDGPSAQGFIHRFMILIDARQRAKARSLQRAAAP